MRIVFFVMALIFSVGAANASGTKHQATKPECLDIRFTGIATPAAAADAMFVNSETFWQKRKYANTIEYVLASGDIEDFLARNPIQCNHGNILTCQGFAYFENHKAKILDWSKDLYSVYAAVDFYSGRKNIVLAVRRKDATCAK